MTGPASIASRARRTAPGAEPQAPSGPQVRDGAGRGRGPSPLAVLAAALAVGILLARVIDWRSHAHPRR
jgi:hypothetical protein